MHETFIHHRKEVCIMSFKDLSDSQPQKESKPAAESVSAMDDSKQESTEKIYRPCKNSNPT